MTKFSTVSKMAFLAGALALATASSAYAQSDDITVTAPHFRSEQTRLGGTLQKVSLSSAVHYGDLNLRTRSGAHALRERVRDEAQNVCTRIAEAYPVKEAQGTNCYKTALNDGLIRADAAIRNARDRRYAD
jgi:UrcA family protein